MKFLISYPQILVALYQNPIHGAGSSTLKRNGKRPKSAFQCGGFKN
jgi:hypothetical protein